MRILAILILTALQLSAATYYIDFDGGSDSNAGTSTVAAFKHSPDDPNATSTANSTEASLAAGDTIVFKGGVRYYGRLVPSRSGTPASPITYLGQSSWGTGKAILDGTIAVSTSWTQCADSADAGGNANFANIYYTTIPSTTPGYWTALQGIIVSNRTMLPIAQDPNPADWLHFDDYDLYHTADSIVAGSTITDASYFTQSDSSFWIGAYAIWHGGSELVISAVTNFNTSTDAVIVDKNVSPNENKFSMMGHPSLIDYAGEYCFRTNENRLYLWPYDAGMLTDGSIRMSSEAFGVYRLGTLSNVVFNGFEIMGYQGGRQSGEDGGAIRIAGAGAVTSNIQIVSNEVSLCRVLQGSSIISVTYTAPNTYVADNLLHDNWRCRGIGVGGSTNQLVLRNELYQMGDTPIYLSSTVDSVIASNKVGTFSSTHGNGIVVYTATTNCLIKCNFVTNCARAMTFEYGHNVKFHNNVVIGNEVDSVVYCWGGMSGTVEIYNNTWINWSAASSFSATTAGATWLIFNNILGDAPNVTDRAYNLFNRSPTGGLKSNEATNIASLWFQSSNDFRLLAASQPVNYGTNLASITHDVVGTLRQTHDAGGFEYVPLENPGVTRAATVAIGTPSKSHQ